MKIPARRAYHILERDGHDARQQRAASLKAGDRLKVSQLMGDVGDALIVKHEPGAKLVLRLLQLHLGHTLSRHTVESLQGCCFGTRQACRFAHRNRNCVQKRMLGRHDGAGNRRGEALLHQGAVQPRAALRRSGPEARPEIQSFCTREHRVQYDHGKEIHVIERRRPVRELQIRGRAFLTNGDSPLSEWLGLLELQPGRRSARRNPAELPLDPAQRVVRSHIANHDQHRVIGDVIAPVMLVELIPAHVPEIAEPADRRVPVRMHFEGRGGHFGVEQLVRIVLAALQLGDDHRPL